jgi:hypothetical protein
VPAAQAALGAHICTTLDTPDSQFEAAGYHAKAQDLNGRTIAGGGFYCVRKYARLHHKNLQSPRCVLQPSGQARLLVGARSTPYESDANEPLCVDRVARNR